LEKIREALAKARSDKAFRQQHPVADVARYEKPTQRESNDTSGLPVDGTPEERLEGPSEQNRISDPEMGSAADVDTDAGGEATDLAPSEGEVVMPGADPAPVSEVREPEAPSFRDNSVRRAAVIDIEENAVPDPPDTDEPAPVVAENLPPARRSGSKRSKWLVIGGVGGLMIFGGAALVHVFLVPLDTVWAALTTGDGTVGEALGPVMEKTLRWVEHAVDVLVSLLGAPEPS